MANLPQTAWRRQNQVLSGIGRNFGGHGITATLKPGIAGINGIRYQGGGGNAISPAQMSSLGLGSGTTDYNAQLQAMYDAMAAGMEEQAAAQADYMAQMQALQEQQLLMQQEAAKAADVESGKAAGDFTVSNADDVARKQLLRRGLMSTFSRYPQSSTAKAAKLGG